MPETLPIKPSDLQIDEENSRILDPNEGQAKALHALAEELGSKLAVHASDIAQWGLDPSALLIVEEMQGKPTRYRVLEGNRRVASLRALENPELVAGSVEPNVLKKLRKLNKEYLKNPIEQVNCVVMTTEEARHWIELKHTGQNEGAGVVEWGPDEKARFQTRFAGKSTPPHIQALEFLQRRGDLSSDLRKKLPTTTFQRLIDTPAVRGRLGVNVINGVLELLGPEDRVVRALMHVIHDLASGRVKVRQLDRQHQRQAYADGLPSSVAVSASVKPGHGTPIQQGSSTARGKRKAARPGKRVRDRLIPTDCVLNIPDNRNSQIEHELRRTLSLEKHTNAVAVLFRVFVELSLDEYLAGHPVAGVNENSKLITKIEQVTVALEAAGRLTRQQGKAIRSANNENSSLLPGTATMNAYVHNQHAYPAPSDLRQHWNSLQPMMTAIWT